MYTYIFLQIFQYFVSLMFLLYKFVSLSWNNSDSIQPHTMMETVTESTQTEKSSTEIYSDFQNCPLFERYEESKELTMQDMATFYEAAIDAKMLHNDIQICEILLYEMLDLCLTPTAYSTKLIMAYYLRKDKFDDVLRMFENIPKWGGTRNYVHGSMVITALANVGRLSDAWRGMNCVDLIYVLC